MKELKNLPTTIDKWADEFAKELPAEWQESFKSLMKVIKGIIELLPQMIKLLEWFVEKILPKIVKGLTWLMDTFNSLSDSQKELVGYIVGVGGLLWAFGLLGTSIKFLASIATGATIGRGLGGLAGGAGGLVGRGIAAGGRGLVGGGLFGRAGSAGGNAWGLGWLGGWAHN